MGIQALAVTHPGTLRNQNEDRWLIDPELGLCIISDGVTHPFGAYCAEKVCKDTHDFLKQHRDIIDAHAKASTSPQRQLVGSLLCRAIEHVSASIYQETQKKQQMRGLFATVCVVLVSRGYAFLAHLGDSRIYSIREGVFHLLTRDHTYLSAMLAEGKSFEDAKRVEYCDNLSMAIGHQPVARASAQIRELAPDERLLLCTDGISDCFAPASFRAPEWAAMSSEKLAEIVRDHALKRSARDNLTAVVIDWDRRTDSREILDKIGTVRGIRLFDHLGEKSLMKFLSLADTRAVQAGETLIQKGGISNEIYIVLSGSFSVDFGQGAIPTALKRGEVIGEMSTFDGALPSATLIALEPSSVLVLHRDQLFRAMKEDRDFAARFELGVLQAVIRRLRARTEPDEELQKMQNFGVVSIFPDEET